MVERTLLTLQIGPAMVLEVVVKAVFHPLLLVLKVIMIFITSLLVAQYIKMVVLVQAQGMQIIMVQPEVVVELVVLRVIRALVIIQIKS